MSRFTKFLDKPASVTADAAVAIGVGAAAMIVLPPLLPAIPIIGGLEPLLSPGIAGVLAGATYLRARLNLSKQPPS